MQEPSKIAHPLKNRTGTSQRTRLIDALQPEAAPIDGKTLADRLYLICEYARYINFHTYVDDAVEGEYQQLDTWTSFFANSLPFQLAKLSMVSVEDLEEQFLVLYNELKANPTKQSLESLLGFVYDKLIVPTDALYKTVAEAENSFMVPLLAIVKSSFIEPLKCYIALYNASATFLCVDKKKFTEYLAHPWQLKVDEVYALDLCIKRVKKGKKEAYLMAAEVLNSVFYQMLNGFQAIVEEAPLFIEESLKPLEESLRKKHQAHLALLFTFLELLKYFQGNINELGKKHLDFFYEQVLKMIPKDAVPDKAHIVFEVAKHLEAYPLPKDLLLKDGKDANKQDIQFGLDHEVVLDKAQVKELRTLAINKVYDGVVGYTEGVYIAPVANSKDGLGTKFKEDESSNWPTLGSKYSKNLVEDPVSDDGLVQCNDSNRLGKKHPIARLGFVLSSPVLLLQEGTRTISIIIECRLHEDANFDSTDFSEKIDQISVDSNAYLLTLDKVNECIENVPGNFELSEVANRHLEYLFNENNLLILTEDELDDFLDAKKHDETDIFTINEKNKVEDCIKSFETLVKCTSVPLFECSFSGEEEWLKSTPENCKTCILTTNDKIIFEIKTVLEPDFPPIVFYDREVLGENLELNQNFPLVKIELSENLKIQCEYDPRERSSCCLKEQNGNEDGFSISPYHYLKQLQLIHAQIDVEVCGVKNLIVQNDENLQDVNKPIYPFGPRPKVGENWIVDKGANFYIGSKEIFCKNWKKFWINTTWKDKPADIHEHYRFYRDPNFENGDPAITTQSFRFATSFLNDGAWIKDKINSNHHNPADLDWINDADPSISLYEKDYELEYEPGQLMTLFENVKLEPDPCSKPASEDDIFCHNINEDFFTGMDGYSYEPKSMPLEELEPLTVNTRKGFIRLTLAGVSFQHEIFTYILTRQMMALADLVDPQSIADALVELENIKILSNKSDEIIAAILIDINEIISEIGSLRTDIGSTAINNSTLDLADEALIAINNARSNLPGSPGIADGFLASAESTLGNLITDLGNLGDAVTASSVHGGINNIIERSGNIQNEIIKLPVIPIFTFPLFIPDNIHHDYLESHLDEIGLQHLVKSISTKVQIVLDLFDTKTKLGLPKEPYTPLIKSLSIDYRATATIEDMEIVHLYPFENTSKGEAIEQNPTLFPYFDDEGTLFIGIEALTPGGTLSLLFQLAEATADSEQDRAEIHWHYLTNNHWVDLLPDFDVISDETDGLTVSGIVTIAVPDAISKIGNTVMPDNLYWLKVSAPENVRAVAETIGIHTQAAKASARLNELNDTNRLETALEAGSIGKLQEGDFSIKKVEQPYSAFGGRKPEAEGHFYTRVSEHLKHKGRGLMINDYEKVVLEGFPEIYKVKCISHTMGLSANEYRRDLEVAPGFVVVAVIPDLTKLKAGNQLTPKAPVSLLEKIGDHLRKKISPFARLKIMNPRYEPVDVCVSVRLYRGKSENFYAKKLQEDLTFFLAPWFLGDTEKLAFGEEVLFSDVVGFIEQLDYVDFIVDLKLEGLCEQTGTLIQPLTARSILTAGTICVKIDKEKCPEPIGNDIATELI